MDDFKEMYYHLAHEVEKAMRILVKAQQDCEEMYLVQGDAEEQRPRETQQTRETQQETQEQKTVSA